MGETPVKESVIEKVMPTGLKRIFNSSKTWLVILASLIVYYVSGGFGDDAALKTEAIGKLIEFLKWAIPTIIIATGVEDCGGKIFGKVGELVKK